MTGDNKKPKQEDSSSSLNLGFGELLSDAESGASEPPPSVAPNDSSEPNQESPPVVKSELAALASESRWEDLILHTERTLAPSLEPKPTAERMEAQIYWILAELRRGGVPLSILIAPLDEVCAGMASPETKAALGEGPHLGLVKVLIPIVAEIERALRAQGDANGADLCRMHLVRLGSEEPLPQGETSGGSKSKEPADLPKPVPGGPPSPRKQNYLGTFVLLVLLALVSLYLIDRYRLTPLTESSPPAWAAERLVLSRALPAPSLPPVSLQQGAVSELDALLFDLERKKRPVEAPPSKEPAPETSNVPAQGGAVSEPAAEPKGQQVRRPVVDTSGPLEPPDFPVTEEYDRGRARERPREGRPEPRTERGGDRNATNRPLGPQVAEPPRFEDFRGTRRFRVIKDTDVMPEPTFRGERRDRLPVGAEVEAEGREGYWLRIRSERGRIGYIFSQDVERVREW